MQAEIAKLLQSDWFSAVDRCQLLLDTTTSTLSELNEILLRETHLFVALLLEIQGLATAAEDRDAEETVQRVIEHVDRIAAWGSARQQAWSEYYQYVHRYLRDVVRLDPDRALSQRLRDQAAAWPTSPFFLLVAHAPSIRLLRALEARVDRPPVARPRTGWLAGMDAPQAEGPFASFAELSSDLEDLLRTEIAGAYLLWMDANARAVADDANGVSVDIGGTTFVQKPQRYAAKAFGELKRKRALVADEALAVLLAATGIDDLLAGARDDADADDDDDSEGDDQED